MDPRLLPPADVPPSAARPAGAPEGFPPVRRVRRRRDFQRTYAEGRKVVGRHFVLFVRPGGATPPRLGITATRKVAGAVGRNRIRRQVREVFRRTLFPDGASGELVVNVRNGAPEAPFASLATDLESLFRRAYRGSGGIP